MSLTFRVASEEWEFKQIHQLNYRTFVEEIPQHASNTQQLLVDKFHHENRYLIALDDATLIGMVAVRDQRPFSLDGKLNNLERYLPPHRSIFEIRLLAIAKRYRQPRVFAGLLHLLAQYHNETNHDLAVMSGTLRQSRLYKHLGFEPFGPLVGDEDAPYQPMYLTLSAFEKMAAKNRFFSQMAEGRGP